MLGLTGRFANAVAALADTAAHAKRCTCAALMLAGGALRTRCGIGSVRVAAGCAAIADLVGRRRRVNQDMLSNGAPGLLHAE